MKTRIFFVIISIFIFSQVCQAQFCAKLKNISAGEFHTLALADNNGLYVCGGYNANYCPQLGLCDEVYRTPLLQHVCGPNGVGNLNNIIAFDAGWVHSLAVDSNGFCYAWGSDDETYGLLGNGPNEGSSSVPIRVHGLNNDSNGLRNIVKVSAGRSGLHSLAIDSSGHVYAWGWNIYYQCGDESTTNRQFPVLVWDSDPNTSNCFLSNEANIVDVDAGVHHSLAMVKYEDGGYVYEWGGYSYSYYTYPHKVHGENGNGYLRNIVDIATCYVSLAVDVNGWVWQWTTGTNNPARVLGLEHIVKVAAGETTYAAIDCNGQVWQWYADDANPVKVAAGQMETESGFLEDINAIDVGYSDHLVAVDKYGNGWGWSTNDNGQLGVGDYMENHYTPTKMLCPLVCEPNVYITKDPNTHYTTIGAAVSAAASGDTLVAYPALYCERPDFDSKQLTLKSFDPNNPFIVACTRILGNEGDCTVTVGADSTINGFTIIGGRDIYGIYSTNNSNLTINNCRVGYCDRWPEYEDSGISIYCVGGTATISNTLVNNLAGHGIYAEGSDITVDRCQIADNGLAGIYVSGGSAEITNSIIHNNTYGGIYLDNCSSSPEIKNNTIVYNSSYGISRNGGSNPDVNSNIIYYNNNNTTQLYGISNNVNYNCIENYTGGTNINSNPQFRDANAYDYHLKYNSPCIDKGDPNFSSLTEKDIDGEDRVNSGRIDIGSDEFYYCSGRVDIFPDSPDGIVNFLDFAVLANAWMTEDPNSHYNDVVDFNSDGRIDIYDFNEFCDCWLDATGKYLESHQQSEGEMDMMMQEQESETESIFYSEDYFAESQEENQSEENQYYYPADYNLPEIYLTCDNNNPEPNDEVTIWIHSDSPLICMGLSIYVAGDANITTAMGEADCNEYGWDNGWNSDPGYLDDVDYWVYLSGIRWDADANGVISYVKFRYNSGTVNVSFDMENSIAFTWDWESGVGSYVPLSQEAVIVAHDPNDP